MYACGSGEPACSAWSQRLVGRLEGRRSAHGGNGQGGWLEIRRTWHGGRGRSVGDPETTAWRQRPVGRWRAGATGRLVRSGWACAC